jgi:hypothetical protein
MAEPQSFETVVAEDHDGRVYLPVPFDPSSVWGVKPRHHVGGVLDGKSFRGVVEIFDGRLGVVIGPAWRRTCGLAPGQAVRAVLNAEGPQQAELAPDIVEALAAEPQASEFFDGLAQFYRKAYLSWIDATKRRPEVRAARIAEVVRLLKAGEKQRPNT